MAFGTNQVANFLGVKPNTVRKLASSGELIGHKHADERHWLFEKEDLAYFIMLNDKYFRYFLSYKPSSIYQDSYDILLKEIRRRI